MVKRASYYVKTANGDVFSTTMPECHKDCEVLPRAKGAELYREQTRKELLKKIKPGQTVYCNIGHVSASGMQRRISFYIIHKGELNRIDHSFAVITGSTESDKGGIVVHGCGMDMCFASVYDLGRYLWPKGTPRAHGTRNGTPDKDGGYALKHSIIG